MRTKEASPGTPVLLLICSPGALPCSCASKLATGIDATSSCLIEAIELVASKRAGDGRWPLETRYPGVMPVETDEGEGQPSRWNTLHALRVLRWYEGG